MSIEVPIDRPTPSDAALNALAAGLERLRASSIERYDTAIVFTVDFFRFVLNTNLPVPIEGGTVRVETSEGALKEGALKVTYRLGTVRILIIASVAAFFFLAFSRSFAVGAMAWLALFGGNYLLAAVRFRWFVERCVNDTCDDWAKLARSA